MRYQIDHDYHIHTHLSICSSDEGQTPDAILQIAKQNGLKKICITDHFWDETVPCNTLVNWWYEKQNYAHIAQSLSLPQDRDAEFLFGCEADMDSDDIVGISKEHVNDFGFIIVSTTHFHHMGGALWGDRSNEVFAHRWVERFDALLNADLPFHKTGVAHLACGLINNRSREDYLDTLDRIPQRELERLFSKAAARGIGIELNSDDMSYKENEADTVLRLFRTAKYCGCKFYLGSDAHERWAFNGVDEIFERCITALSLTENDKFGILQ